MNTVHGMIAFLRAEADLAEARAKQLRLTAALIQSNQNERPSTEPTRKKRKKGTDVVGGSVDTAGAASSLPAAAPGDVTRIDVQHRHPYGMGYALFLQSHLSELNKQQQQWQHLPPPTSVGRDAGSRRRAGRTAAAAAAAAAEAAEKAGPPDGEILLALEQRWVSSGHREKRAWQTRAEQMHQAAAATAATAAATATTTATPNPGNQGVDPSPVSIAAAVAAAAGTSLEYDEGEEDEDEVEDDDDTDDGDDDDDGDADNLEPLDAAEGDGDGEGDDDWADRKRPATKKPGVPV